MRPWSVANDGRLNVQRSRICIPSTVRDVDPLINVEGREDLLSPQKRIKTTY